MNHSKVFWFEWLLESIAVTFLRSCPWTRVRIPFLKKMMVITITTLQLILVTMVTRQRAILTHCQSLGRDYDTLVHAVSLSLQLLHCIIRREIEHFKTLLVFRREPRATKSWLR